MSDRESYFRRRVESVEVQGVTRYVVPLSGDQAEALIASEKEGGSEVRITAMVVCFAATTADGVRVFSDADVDVLLTRTDFDVIQKVADKALEVSGLGAKDSGND